MKIDTSVLVKNVALMDAKMDTALKIYAGTQAKKFEGYAKVNRKWTDRTGDARKRLTGRTESFPLGQRIILSHGVEYGIWLELANDKNFAIIEPTINALSKEAIEGLYHLMYKIGLSK